MAIAMLPCGSQSRMRRAGAVVLRRVVALANVSFEFSAVFHNAMLPTIAPPERVRALSGLGLSLGNAAGIILLALHA